MEKDNGWIKLHRKIIEHWIWDDPVKLKMWIDLLLLVNHEEKKVNIGNSVVTCGRGETIHSLTGLSKRWNVSKDTARNFLELLVRDHMILRVNLIKSTRITICNYECYQSDLHVKKPKFTRKTNATSSQTRTKEYKKEEIIINNNKLHIAEFVFLSDEEHKKLIEEFGKSDTNRMIEILNNYKGSSGKKYKSDYLAIRNWVVDRLKKEKTQNGYGKRTELPSRITGCSFEDPDAIR